MSYVPTDFTPDKSGPQFQWLAERLTVHGFPASRLLETLKDRTAAFQRAQGWSGTGADGLPGPKTLLRLSASPTPVEMPPPSSGAIDLTPWKVTLPVGEPGHPDEVFPIGSFEESPWFIHSSDGIRFRAHCGGVTTSGSSYPRCELREMNGSKLASWSNESGNHTMAAEMAITHTPVAKPHVVAAQIHDAKDDIVEVRLEDKRLFVESDGKEIGVLDPAYLLGSRFDLIISAGPAGISIAYKNKATGTQRGVGYKRTGSGWYFKAGCYTQSSTNNKDPWPDDKPDAYGEVIINALSVTHI